MRLLHERLDHDHRCAARKNPEADRRPDREALTGLKCRCATHAVDHARRKRARRNGVREGIT